MITLKDIKEPTIVTDIINAQHLLVMPLNDEGDFCIMPTLYQCGNPEDEFIDMLPHGGIIIGENKPR